MAEVATNLQNPEQQSQQRADSQLAGPNASQGLAQNLDNQDGLGAGGEGDNQINETDELDVDMSDLKDDAGNFDEEAARI